jgi:hypothetical protein
MGFIGFDMKGMMLYVSDNLLGGFLIILNNTPKQIDILILSTVLPLNNTFILFAQLRI